MTDVFDEPLEEWSRPIMSQALAGTELIQAGYIGHEFPCHAHPEYVIGVVVRGAKLSRHGGRDVVVPHGTAMLLNPFEEHTTRRATHHWTYAAIYPTPAMIAEWLAEDAQAFRFSRPLLRDSRLTVMVLDLYDSVRQRASSLDTQTRFLDLLAFLQASFPNPRPKSKFGDRGAVVRMQELLDSDLEVDFDLAGVARAAELPSLAALRTFRRHVGCTPHVYRTSQRIGAAKHALRQGQGITETAFQFGFCDQSHFTRTFRRWTGMTPRTFMKAGLHGS